MGMEKIDKMSNGIAKFVDFVDTTPSSIFNMWKTKAIFLDNLTMGLFEKRWHHLMVRYKNGRNK